MLICIADLLSAEELTGIRATLNATRFVDGRATAGWHAALVKRNAQAESNDAVTRELQTLVQEAYNRNLLYQIAARPKRMLPPLFSRYEVGMEYGRHVDDAVMAGGSLRTDIATTLFLSDPDSYDGGELVVESTAGEESYKLPAGCAVVYPASSLHRVAPVTHGVRLAAVSWIQSQVRDPSRRELLFDLETTRRQLFERDGKSEQFDLLSKSIANLLRMWAEV